MSVEILPNIAEANIALQLSRCCCYYCCCLQKLMFKKSNMKKLILLVEFALIFQIVKGNLTSSFTSVENVLQ